MKGAFAIELPELVAGRTLLLIDDIYDAGKMLQEIGRTASSREVFYGSSTIAAMVYDRRSVA